MQTSTCLQEALACIKNGRPIIPIWWIRADGSCACGRNCESPGKHPILSSWKEFQRNTPSVGQVKAWFTEWAEGNAAMLTGTAGGRSNIVVLDDDRPGINPEFSTRTVRTGGGGLHYYFVSNRKYKNSGAKGVMHVRGEGGYVLLPGSTHSSGS